MDDWSWGTGDSRSGFNWDSWYNGGDLGDYGSNSSDYGNTFNTSDPYQNYQWAVDNNSLGQLGGDYSNNSSLWGNLASGAGSLLNSNLGNAAIMGLGSWLSNKDAFNNAKELAELQSKLAQQNYAANAAVNEQYYQAHGKQLSDAIGGYKQYYRDPSIAENNPTNIFGLLTPKPTTGPLANGW